MNKLTIYTTIELSIGTKATIVEANGLHFFNALLNCNGNINMMPKYIILEIMYLNNNIITEVELNNLPICDVLLIYDVINSMMSNIDKYS